MRDQQILVALFTEKILPGGSGSGNTPSVRRYLEDLEK